MRGVRLHQVLLSLFLLTAILLPSVSRGGAGSPLPLQGGYRLYLPNLQRQEGPPPPFGVQMVAIEDSWGLAQAVAAGVRWVRVIVEWRSLEPENTTPDRFRWSAYDGMFASAAAAGLTPLVTIIGNPPWAAETSCGPLRPGMDAQFEEFLYALVSRYNRTPYNVKYWEIYNEPDNGDATNYGWIGGCWGHQGLEYARMLKRAHGAVKGADPSSQVVFGSLAYEWFADDPQPGPFVRDFVDVVLDPARGGAGAYFDVFAFHYFPSFRNNWEQYGTDLIGKVNFFQRKLASYGLTKPMMLTEITMWSAPQHGGSDELQSNYVVQAFVRGSSVGLQAIIWFMMVDYEEEWLYSLLRRDLTPKPAYQAYRTLTLELGGWRPAGNLDSTLSASLEGYAFVHPSDGRTKWVVWSRDQLTYTISVNASRLRVVDKMGTALIYDDANDGSLDGKVKVSIGTSPLYLEPLP